jgi:hypothetical protein
MHAPSPAEDQKAHCRESVVPMMLQVLSPFAHDLDSQRCRKCNTRETAMAAPLQEPAWSILLKDVREAIGLALLPMEGLPY